MEYGRHSNATDGRIRRSLWERIRGTSSRQPRNRTSPSSPTSAARRSTSARRELAGLSAGITPVVDAQYVRTKLSKERTEPPEVHDRLRVTERGRADVRHCATRR